MRDDLFKINIPNTPFPNTGNSLIQIYACGHYRHEADKIPFYRDFWHGYQIFFSITGKGWFEYSGKYRIIEPGDIVCMKLTERHGVGAFPGNVWEHYWIGCNGKIFQYLYNLIFKNENKIKSPNYAKMKHLFIELYNLGSSENKLFNVRGTSIIYQIMCELLPVQQQQSAFDPHTSCINRSIDYIKDNIEKNINVMELSSISGYSVYHFSRLFKKITGFSPGEFIRKTRVEKAKELLLETDLPLDNIAAIVGFETKNSFITSFRKHAFITPGKFRKTAQF